MIKFLSTFTTETQYCIVLVLLLLVVLASGYLGWRMGWDSCVDYIEQMDFTKNIRREVE